MFLVGSAKLTKPLARQLINVDGSHGNTGFIFRPVEVACLLIDGVEIAVKFLPRQRQDSVETSLYAGSLSVENDDALAVVKELPPYFFVGHLGYF